MPKFNDQSQTVKHAAGHFGFSAMKMDDLGASEYTLATIVADRSGSTSGFQSEMENAIKEVVRACKHSPRAENLMLRVLSFDDRVTEIHGFKLLQSINLDDYNGKLTPGGMTSLHDATIDAVEATGNYGQQLLQQDYSVNGLVVVITDGEENTSKFRDTASVQKAFTAAITGEKLESLLSILVGVNQQTCSASLNKLHTEGGFTQYVELKDATKNTLAKLAQFVSQSISSQSQALGSGGPSKALNPSIVF